MALHGGMSVKRVRLSEVVSYNESLLKKTAHDISRLPSHVHHRQRTCIASRLQKTDDVAQIPVSTLPVKDTQHTSHQDTAT